MRLKEKYGTYYVGWLQYSHVYRSMELLVWYRLTQFPTTISKAQGPKEKGGKKEWKTKKERKERRKTREKENGGGAILAGARDSHGPGRRLRPITAYT